VTSEDGTEHEVVAPVQSDLERFLAQAEADNAAVASAIRGPQTEDEHAVSRMELVDLFRKNQANVGPLLAMVRLLQSKFSAPYVRCVVPTEELNRLAREAMGESDA
jgi:hypothetical protein